MIEGFTMDDERLKKLDDRKNQAQTLSPVEESYLTTIKQTGKFAAQKANEEKS